MAEDSSFQSPSDTSPLSNKRSITLTLSTQDPSSSISAVFDDPQETRVSPEQSPKKVKPSSLDCPLLDCNLVDGVSKEKLILGEVASETTRVPMSLGDSNEVFGVVLGEKSDSLRGLNEISMVDVDVVDVVSEEPLISEGDNGVNCESFGLVLLKNDEGSSGIQELSVDMGDRNSEKVVDFDGNSEVYGVELGEKNVGFDRKGEIDELIELKDEVSAIWKENSSEIVQLGSSESQSDGTIEATALCSKSNENEFVEKGDLPTYSMKIELLDETAVVDVLVNGGKKSRRKGRKDDFNAASGSECSDGAKRMMKYSRKEMEKLRFVNVKAQKTFWQEVYNGLTDTVRKEYSALCSFKHQKQKGLNSHKDADKRSFSDQGLLGDSSSGNVSCDAEMLSPTHASFNGENIGKDGNDLEWIEDEESDDEYHSLRRPAFMVQGDPDFESGPPEDGFEYLRRVRWEAERIPKVKVVNVNRGKLKEQSVYMPKIPDIEKCPLHLAPSSQWEEEFIADFSELRLALSDLDDTNDATSVDCETIVFGCPVPTKRPCKTLTSLDLPAGGPTLSTIHGMDAVTRVALLNKRIQLFENATNLSKDDCAWLFALCAVVETPLHADTCASLRCLLRRCAKLRAEKPELDDEVIMLNILATIAGKYFRQSEN